MAKQPDLKGLLEGFEFEHHVLFESRAFITDKPYIAGIGQDSLNALPERVKRGEILGYLVLRNEDDDFLWDIYVKPAKE